MGWAALIIPDSFHLTEVQQLHFQSWARSLTLLLALFAQGFSGCIGLAAGLALKKIGQLLALVIGLGFIIVQESVGGTKRTLFRAISITIMGLKCILIRALQVVPM